MGQSFPDTLESWKPLHLHLHVACLHKTEQIASNSEDLSEFKILDTINSTVWLLFPDESRARRILKSFLVERKDGPGDKRGRKREPSGWSFLFSRSWPILFLLANAAGKLSLFLSLSLDEISPAPQPTNTCIPDRESPRLYRVFSAERFLLHLTLIISRLALDEF